jgi:predicted MFS family arabinose efflux permease
MLTPAMRILAVLGLAIGVLLGADEVAIAAVAKALSGPAAAAPLFIVWGLGSFLGGLAATRLGGGARSGLGLALLLGALGVGHLALIPAQGAFLAMAAVLFVAGATISPTEATVNAMVERATPSRMAAEAFAWLATAVEVGSGIGASTAGVLIDRVGAGAVFALAGGVVAAAAIATLVRSSTLGTNARQTPESSNRRSINGLDPTCSQ